MYQTIFHNQQGSVGEESPPDFSRIAQNDRALVDYAKWTRFESRPENFFIQWKITTREFSYQLE